MSAAIIVLIGDSKEDLTTALQKRYTLYRARSGKEGQQLAAQHRAQIIVLDAISLRTSGERTCRRLQKSLPDTPLIHLHPGNHTDAASCADEVLFLPFTWRKVVNAIERLLDVDNAMQAQHDLLRCGPFALNIDTCVLLAHDKEVTLTPRQTDLLKLFMQHPGQTLDRAWLMQQVWETDYVGDTRTLSVHVRMLRQALERDSSNPQYLLTVRGEGYRFVLPD